MLGVEGDGAGEFAPGFEPDRLRGILVEDVQRLLRQQRQHQRRIELRLVPDGIDNRRVDLGGRSDLHVVDPVDELQRDIEKRLPDADAKPVCQCGRNGQPDGEQAKQDRSGQDHAACLPVPRTALAAACGMNRSGTGAKVNCGDIAGY